MSRELTLEELIKASLEKHSQHPAGHCNCGFCVCGPLHQAAMLAPEIERLLAAERQPMECEHPRACAPPCDFCKGSGRAIDLAAGVYGGQLRKPCPLCHGTGLLACSFCVQLKAEREKVRKMCGVVARDYQMAVASMGRAGVDVASDIEHEILLLNLTKDLTPSSTEEGGK